MKKIFTVLAIFALVLAGCGDKDTSDDGNGNGTTTGTTLTIKNTSDYNGMEISYGNVDFGTIARGGEAAKKVSEGTKYISIIFHSDFGERFLRVNEAITCEEGKNTQFTISNNTVITIPGGYKGENKDETGSLKNIIDSMLNYFREQE